MSKIREATSCYHFAESYLSREQIERVLNHYRDYIVSALYILHDKDVHRVEDDGGVRRSQLEAGYKERIAEVERISSDIDKAVGAGDFNKSKILKRALTREKKKLTRAEADLRQYEDEVAKDGQPQTPHWHVLIKTYGAHTANAVRDWFYRFHVVEEVEDDDGNKIIREVNTFNRICGSVGACRDYLTHKNEPEKLHKHIYDTSEVLTFGAGWQAFNKASRSADDALEVCERMMNNDSFRSMIRDYGKDFIYHFKQYEYICQRIQHQESRAEWLAHNSEELIKQEGKTGTLDYYALLDKINTAIYIAEMRDTIIREISKAK